MRYAITSWRQDAPRGAVTAFCREHGISRKTFYAIRERARREGAVAAWAPRSRRPASSPSRIPSEVIEEALRVRADLEGSGLDCGPISVHDRMLDLGLPAPSRATLARAFLAAGVIQPAPRKRPRSSYRRFVYPAPNCLWQLDGFDYPLAGGKIVTVLQVIDDHSRKIVASLAAPGETSQAALSVVRTGISRHGVPQKFLTDNGIALNPTRRNIRGQLVDFLRSLGVTPITGRPSKPTTQGKSERHHQTSMQWLNKHEAPRDLTELQDLLEAFEIVYNTQRHHQALPGRITPEQAWLATPKAPEPPLPIGPELPPPHANPQGQATRTATKRGLVTVIGHEFRLGKEYARTIIHIQWDPQWVEFFTETGTSLWRIRRPAPGSAIYVGNGKPAGFMANRHPSPETPTVTEVPRHPESPMS